jgi:2-dehydro-3-deoxyphosphooctonate aldolase (KDO 8-P synthase)
MAMVTIGPVQLGGGAPLALIAGPCVIEGRAHTVELAGAIAEIARQAGVPLIFKASFDKANRTSGWSYRGPGLDAGLQILAEVKRACGVPVLTDIHEAAQAQPAAAVCDVLQIPAFLCRQTDLLQAAARSGAAVNIKKGQFVAPWDMAHAIEKVRAEGNARVSLTERGTSFGYRNLVVDMRALEIMRGFGVPVIFDVTHSLQLPGGAGDASGGERQYGAGLLRAAVACGVDGLFIEVHERPEQALSDAATQWPLNGLAELLEQALAVDRARREVMR